MDRSGFRVDVGLRLALGSVRRTLARSGRNPKPRKHTPFKANDKEQDSLSSSTCAATLCLLRVWIQGDGKRRRPRRTRVRPRPRSPPNLVEVSRRRSDLGFGLQKWSKGKQKEKVNNAVLFDQANYDKMLSEVPKYKQITPSVLSERLRVKDLDLIWFHPFDVE
ncbi:hypothetical protein GW17_00009615 [Ensete ventricosum]|nr:hypothetical protein GW17_00009615 [Ensete ventricosum]RZS10484.1 hypothetical protein BHM03_00041715 [Ensete ventricosum]